MSHRDRVVVVFLERDLFTPILMYSDLYTYVDLVNLPAKDAEMKENPMTVAQCAYQQTVQKQFVPSSPTSSDSLSHAKQLFGKDWPGDEVKNPSIFRE